MDNRESHLPRPSAEWIAPLCRRSLGVGADGLVLVEKSDLANFQMRIFNADGSEAEMCGNGVRCLYQFLYDEGIAQGAIRVETMERLLEIWGEDGEVAVEMGEAKDVQLGLSLEGHELHYLDTGVPHVVIFMDHVADVPLREIAMLYRAHKEFPKGVNVNLAELQADGSLLLRTWERGVEGETLACGTGACAAAVAAGLARSFGNKVRVKVASGALLTITFSSDLSRLVMRGPACQVYRGEITLSTRQKVHTSQELSPLSS